MVSLSLSVGNLAILNWPFSSVRATSLPSAPLITAWATGREEEASRMEPSRSGFLLALLVLLAVLGFPAWLAGAKKKGRTNCHNKKRMTSPPRPPTITFPPGPSDDLLLFN